MKKIKPRNYWNNKENCSEAAKTCNSRLEFKNKFRTAYQHCCKNKWIDDVCLHMSENLKPKHYWTKERCKEEALKHTKKYYLKTAEPVAYRVSREKGWLEEICVHMIKRNSKN